MTSRPSINKLDFSKINENKSVEKNSTAVIADTSGKGQSWSAVKTPINLELIKSHSSGVLKFSPDESYEFTVEDLEDMGVIGQGCFGSVYKMRHRKTSTLLAVKRIRCNMVERELKHLLKELEVITKSDNCLFIVKFYGAVFTEGDCLICMELMDISLERLYKFVTDKLDERLPEEIIGKVAYSTLKALSYLKQYNIIHRDVKPSNLLLNTQGAIKLCDFGISGQLVDSIAKSRDVGCKPYMAPERIDPHRMTGYDVRSDVWSFGITLVEVATGKFPYPVWNSMFDQLQSVVHGDPPILTPKEHPYFTLDFIRFVNSCITKDGEQRPKYPQLMETPFFRKYETAQVDVGGYVRRVLDKIQIDEEQQKMQ